MQGVLFERDQQDPSRWDEIFMALRPVQMPLALESKSIPKEIAGAELSNCGYDDCAEFAPLD
eukprot:757919-Hanusia_phi.AAC.4